jgi:hypothetical protein
MKFDSCLFSKIGQENSSFIKIGQELRILYTKTTVIFLSYLAYSFLEWEVAQGNFSEKIKSYIV